MTSSTAIRRATTADLEDLVPLFDAYRVFYGQPADSQRARRFLADRLQSGDSVLLLAESKGAAAGFTQIYPTYSSVSTARVWVLNDLFIAPPARRKGVARALLCAAEAFASARTMRSIAAMICSRSAAS